MNTVRAVLAELLGLFLDDWLLAVTILAAVVLAALASWTLHQTVLAAIVLVAGCLGALAASTLRR